VSSRQAPWIDRAHHIIDEYERGLRKGHLAQSSLARLLGVSRQTLWRNDEIKVRLKNLAELESHPGGSAKRKSSAAQIRTLRIQIEDLEDTNRRLIQNFVVLCRSLDERGLDPIELIGVSASDLIGAKRTASWR
jgi:hypothetical protein